MNTLMEVGKGLYCCSGVFLFGWFWFFFFYKITHCVKGMEVMEPRLKDSYIRDILAS